MKHVTLLPLALMTALAGCLGCGGGSSKNGDPPSTTGSTVTATDANNYSFASTLTFPPVTVAPDSDLTFDWSALTTDFLGHPVDAATEIDKVDLMLWTLTRPELEEKLNNDTLAMSDLGVIATLFPEGDTNGNLFSFTSVGMPITEEEILPFVNIENYPPDLNIYTAIAATGETLGTGTRMIQAFVLDANTDNTEIVITDTSTDLQYTVDLQSLQAITIPAGDASVVLDWASLTTNGLGQEFNATSITRVAVARYDASPAELEDDFLGLVNYDASVNADSLWEGQVVSGSSFSLADLTDSTGSAFPGIDADSTWMVALFCGNCRNPAPWFLSFLVPG